MADLLLSFLIIIIPSLIQLTNANPRKEIVVQKCKTTHSHNTTQFLHNYKASSDMVRAELTRNLFGYASAGEPPDKVYLMAQCHPDLPITDCIACFQTSNEMLSGCTSGTGGRIFLDGCFMRAENYSFYNDPPTYSEKFCGTTQIKGYEEEQNKFNEVVMQVFEYLVDKTLMNRGFGSMSMEASDKTIVQAVAICWKLTDYAACRTCLDNAAKSILHCLPRTEARIATDNCFLRYADYPFLNPLKESRIKSVFVSFTSYIVLICIGCTIAISVGILAGSIVHARVHRRKSKVKGIHVDSSIFKRNFKYSTLEKATNFFNEMNKLGEGASSEVFKGCLADGREIAVKRLFISYRSQSDDIDNELYIISHAQHKNVVRFLGCCLTIDVTLFVYEFLPNKSLDNFLFDPEKKKELNWKKRFGIIMGTAEGIQYLHNDSEQLIVHRDIKASNILLDLRYRPKIADFGLARFCSEDKSLVSTPICGTLGYMAPEYMAHGELSDKIDVYSFGVLVLEIVSGFQNSKFKQDESLDTLVTVAWKHFKSNTVTEIIDRCLKIDDMEYVTRVIHVGLLCAQQSPSLRPTMTKAIEMLIQKDLHLPTPSKPPFVANTSMEFSQSSFSSKIPSEPSSSCTPHYSDYDQQ